jgi:hypothetical protein
MSLSTDPTLLALWKDAQRQSSDEWASVAVWSQLWNKHIFWEKEWVVCPETPPEGKGRRPCNGLLYRSTIGATDHRQASATKGLSCC